MLDLLHLDLDTAILEIQVAFSKFCWGNLCESPVVKYGTEMVELRSIKECTLIQRYRTDWHSLAFPNSASGKTGSNISQANFTLLQITLKQNQRWDQTQRNMIMYIYIWFTYSNVLFAPFCSNCRQSVCTLFRETGYSTYSTLEAATSCSALSSASGPW